METEEMNPNRDIAWAAGLFEGEGTISYRIVGLYHYLRFQLVMTDEQEVRDFGSIIGVGAVHGPYLQRRSKKDGSPTKPFWRWSVDSFKNTTRVWELLKPFLGERRKQQFWQIKKIIHCEKQSTVLESTVKKEWQP